jgi:hypothetical protein
MTKEPRDPLKLARYYQSLLDSGQFENRAALARYLGVSRARVTQVLKRLDTNLMAGSTSRTIPATPKGKSAEVTGSSP